MIFSLYCIRSAQLVKDFLKRNVCNTSFINEHGSLPFTVIDKALSLLMTFFGCGNSYYNIFPETTINSRPVCAPFQVNRT